MSAEGTGQAIYVLTHNELTQLASRNIQVAPPHDGCAHLCMQCLLIAWQQLVNCQ